MGFLKGSEDVSELERIYNNLDDELKKVISDEFKKSALEKHERFLQSLNVKINDK
ncbi:hypothetical protein ACDI16_04285 [Oceanobacillus caeni]